MLTLSDLLLTLSDSMLTFRDSMLTCGDFPKVKYCILSSNLEVKASDYPVIG